MATTTPWPVVELRRYALHPRKREALIALFDAELVESQEECGMDVIAQFRDVDDPNVFTWLRGFQDMDARRASLTAFYGGPVWAAHRDSANATMIDSDNVRLLRPVSATSGFEHSGAERADRGAASTPSGLTVVTIYTLAPHAVAGFADFFDRIVAPEMIASGAAPCATFETEPSENTFPRLPVREGEHCFVWFAQFDDIGEYAWHAIRLQASREWRERSRPMLERCFSAPAERWRLTPTARSLPLACSGSRVASSCGPQGWAAR